MLFRIKAGLARSVAVLSRISGRGGGTTLPGKLLLADAAGCDRQAGGGAPRRLGADLGHQRQDDDCQDGGVDPVPEPDRLPQRLRRQPGLRRRLRAAQHRRRRPRAVRGGRGRPARRGGRADAVRGRLGEPVSRPARPLRGAGAGGRAMAGDGSRAPALLDADLQRRRPAGGLDRTRPREHHLVWHRRSRGRAGPDAARRRLEVVRSLRPSLRIRLDHARSPGRLALPQLR